MELEITNVDGGDVERIELAHGVDVGFFVNPRNQFTAEQGVPSVQIGRHDHFTGTVLHEFTFLAV